MPNNNNNNSDNTIIYRFEKGDYVSFNSINPYQYGTFTSTCSNQKEGKTFNGIIEEVGHGSVVIRSRGLEYRRDENSVTLLSKQHRYLRCREPPSKSWYGSIGSGYYYSNPMVNQLATKKNQKYANQSKESHYLVLICF